MKYVFGFGLATIAMTGVPLAGVALAQNAAAWDGLYLGANLGGLTSSACGRSALAGANIDPATPSFSNCSSGGAVGGLQFGENFQISRLVLGIGADVIISQAKNGSSTLTLASAQPPAGVYSLSGRSGPKDFAIFSGRVGYGGNLLFPYLRAGAVLTQSRSNALAYTPAGTTAPTASFDGGKNFNSSGWVAGAGAEIGLNGAWSLSAEYLHMSLGKGSSSTTACAGAAAACSAFAGVSLNNTHDAYTANIIRIGINYWFNYWDKP